MLELKEGSSAFRFYDGKLDEITLNSDISLENLIAIDINMQLADINICSFVEGKPFLNMLLWGEKGAGKSTLLRLLSIKYAPKNLITIECLIDTPGDIFTLYKLARRYPDKYFLLFFDDISFNDSNAEFRRFKSIIEGGLENSPKNILFAITSNKRLITSGTVADTSNAIRDIYEKDEVSEATSLQARFGLSLGFYPLNKEHYLEAVSMYLDKYGIKKSPTWDKEAEAYAIDRGGRTGRLAKQFASYMHIISQIKI